MTIVTDDEVERVARSIWHAQWEEAWPREGSIEHAQALETARAALAASDRDVLVPRIPTPEMIAAAWAVIEASKKATGIAKLGPGLGVREIWQAMFDAALTPLGGEGR